MKRLILFLLIGLVLFELVVAEENCEIALPRYGVVQCINVQQTETIPSSPIPFSSCKDGNWCSLQLPCLSNCQLIESKVESWKTPIYFSNGCSDLFDTREWKVILNGRDLGEISSASWSRGDTLTISTGCYNKVTKSIDSPPAGTSVQYQQDKIMLKEGWAGSLPDTPISGSEGCILNSQIHEEPGIDNYFDPATNSIRTKDASSYSSVNSFPTNWKIGDHYIFVKDWQTGVADISLTYDKNNNGYWCGGQMGSRKIYSVQKITGGSGKCYAIPQSVNLQNIECCFPSDCTNNPNYGAAYTCNPDNWKCEKTKPCNSQLDCDQTFGTGVCQNKQLNQWTCDTTKKWGTYAGTCINSIKNVIECPSDCTTDEFYNGLEGKCQSRVVLMDCPGGKCCNGGSYKPKDCSGGLICCSQGGGVGECKQTCEASKSTNDLAKIDGGITGNVIGSSSKNKSIVWIVLVVVVLGLVGWYIYYKRSNNGSFVKEQQVVKSTGHCTNCGKPLKEGSVFCSSCGKEVKNKTGISCPKCGKLNEKWRKFCLKCGKSLVK